MASYFLAPALVKLRNEINAKWPKRSKASDGWIGDPSHAARASDHNPDWNASGRRRGIVRAIDVTNNGIDRGALVVEAMQDSRTYYVISKGFIYSRTYNFAKRRYNGINPHNHHVHVSIRTGSTWEYATGAWFGAKTVVQKATRRTISTSAVRSQFRRGQKGLVLTKSNDVKAVQKLLNKTKKSHLPVDGLAGGRTVAAYRKFEESQGFKFADGIPSSRGLIVLASRAVLPTKIVK